MYVKRERGRENTQQNITSCFHETVRLGWLFYFVSQFLKHFSIMINYVDIRKSIFIIFINNSSNVSTFLILIICEIFRQKTSTHEHPRAMQSIHFPTLCWKMLSLNQGKAINGKRTLCTYLSFILTVFPILTSCSTKTRGTEWDIMESSVW